MNKNLHDALSAAMVAFEREVEKTFDIVMTHPEKYPPRDGIYQVMMDAIEEKTQQVDLIRGWLRRNPPRS